MKKCVIAMATVGLSATSVHAGGLDRSGQSIDVLFESGNHLQLSYSYSDPDTSGTDFLSGASTGNVTDSFSNYAFGLKLQPTEDLSLALILDEPYGADIAYPLVPGSVSLGGTRADADSTAMTFLARYQVNDNWSVHGGLRYQEIEANVDLRGLVYGRLNGYSANFQEDSDWGYVVGVAYEIPDIALRVALTYNSEIDHSLQTVETNVPVLGTVASTTDVTLPESLNLGFQTGIAANTLLFGSIRYAKYDDTTVSPVGFDAVVDPGTPGSSITSLEDSTDIELGIGRRLNENWSGSIALGWESEGDDDLVSPLRPTNGSTYISVGARYDVNERLAISGGLRYTDLGDAFAETGTPDTARASFTGNSAVSVGVQLDIKL